MDHSATGIDTCVSGLINFCVFKDTYTALNIAVLTSYSNTKWRRQQKKDSRSSSFGQPQQRVELLMGMKISGRLAGSSFGAFGSRRY